VKHTELRRRLEAALGAGYWESWSRDHAITELGSRTVVEALAAGVEPKEVWEAVWRLLGLPPKDR
jgi:hypothetical protein